MVYLEKNDNNKKIIIDSCNHKLISTFFDDGLSYSGYTSKDIRYEDEYLITSEWNEDRPEILKIHNYKKYETESKPHFEYKINKHGFRSQHFKNLDHNNTNILYSGCSWTFGMGLPEESTWTNMLSNTIQSSSNKKVEVFNIGYRAFSIGLIIKNVMSFIRSYGKPEYLFIVFPDSGRDFIFNKYNNSYSAVDPRYFEHTSDFTADYTKSYRYETNILKYSEMIKMLEDFCNQSGIKLLWTTWYYPDYDIYKNLEFDNLCPTDTTFLQADPGFYRIFNEIEYGSNYPYNNIDNLPYWSVARDLVHPGTAWTTHITKEFSLEIKKRDL
jgi:hypothetical protein